MTTRDYLTCAETAKLIRQALKEAFPGVKFGVRSHVYSGGASVNVRWTDGPNAAQVEEVASRFEGATFDGMTDSTHYNRSMYNGKPVSFGAKYIFCERDYSPALIERAIAALWARNWVGLQGIERPTADDFKAGRCNGVAWSAVIQGCDLRDLIYQTARKRSDRLTKHSNTAAAVIHLGSTDPHDPLRSSFAHEAHA